METENLPKELSPSFPVLPPEILEIILNGLHNPNDILTAINTTRNWREVLTSRKSELFPLVFQVPELVSYLPLSTLLLCRQLNSQTKATIDTLLKIHTTAHPQIYFPFNKNQKLNIFQQKSQQLIQNFYTFDTENHCEKFRIKMGHYKKSGEFNPFILGCVQVDLVDSISFSNYCENLITLFQNYGEYIFSLKIRFGRGFASQVGILLTILESVPNLRHLEVSTEPSLYFFISWPCDFQEIYEWIQECRLPCLESLDVSRCKTYIGRGEAEYWDDWEFWESKPKTVEGALYSRFEEQLVIANTFRL